MFHCRCLRKLIMFECCIAQRAARKTKDIEWMIAKSKFHIYGATPRWQWANSTQPWPHLVLKWHTCAKKAILVNWGLSSWLIRGVRISLITQIHLVLFLSDDHQRLRTSRVTNPSSISSSYCRQWQRPRLPPTRWRITLQPPLWCPRVCLRHRRVITTIHSILANARQICLLNLILQCLYSHQYPAMLLAQTSCSW